MATRVKLNASFLIKKLRDIKITISGKDGLLDLADTWRKRIQGFTRSGKDLTQGSPTFKITRSATRQPALKKSTIGRRFKFAQRNRTHPAFRPGFSNLTMTGDLLDGLQTAADENLQQISVTVGGTRRDGENNKEIARNLAEQGRFFLGLDEAGAKTLGVKGRRNILRQLKNLLGSR